MNEFWYDGIDENVIAYIRMNLEERFLEQFPNILVTDDEEYEGYAVFPSVLISSIEPTEIGQDLTNESVNAIVCTYNITITDNDDRENVKAVARALVGILKELKFNVTLLPKYQNKNGLKYGFIRCTRIVGKDDETFVGS